MNNNSNIIIDHNIILKELNIRTLTLKYDLS